MTRLFFVVWQVHDNYNMLTGQLTSCLGFFGVWSSPHPAMIPIYIINCCCFGKPDWGPDSSVSCISFALSTGSLRGGFNAFLTYQQEKKACILFDNNVGFLSLLPPAIQLRVELTTPHVWKDGIKAEKKPNLLTRCSYSLGIFCLMYVLGY